MLARVDCDELLIALHAPDGDAPFDAFLDRLRRRLGAREAMLERRRPDGSWATRHAAGAGGGAGAAARPDRAQLLDLRPGRVYGLAEIGLTAPGDGRVLRLVNRAGDQWLAAIDRPGGFVAADGALLSSLAPHVALACENRVRAELLHERLAAAEAALARAGVGWALIDAAGERVSGHAVPASPGQRAALAAAIIAGAEPGAIGQTVAVAPPLSDSGSAAAALALFRTSPVPLDRARIFAVSHGVPLAQARLAVAIAQGDTIAQAAARLGITPATARFYSKRLYSATATSGQADLVRLFWTGPAALG